MPCTLPGPSPGSPSVLTYTHLLTEHEAMNSLGDELTVLIPWCSPMLYYLPKAPFLNTRDLGNVLDLSHNTCNQDYLAHKA